MPPSSMNFAAGLRGCGWIAIWPSLVAQRPCGRLRVLRRVADMANRRLEGLAVKMLGHQEAGEAFEHRHFDELAFAGALAVVKRGERA